MWRYLPQVSGHSAYRDRRQKIQPHSGSGSQSGSTKIRAILFDDNVQNIFSLVSLGADSAYQKITKSGKFPQQ